MKRRSKVIVVLLLSFCSITMTVAGCKDLHCYVDYIDTLTCKYNKEDTSLTYSLNVEWTFEEEDDKETCELIPSRGKNEYSCTTDMEDYSYDTKCMVFIRATIDGNETLSTCGPFKIGDKFKPRAPFNLSVSFSENYNVSWRTLYDSDVYRSDQLAYELSYKKDNESWLKQNTVQLYEDEKSLVLQRSLFEADEIYVVRIRARPKNTAIYRGHWGSWSTPVSWRSPAEKWGKNWFYSLTVPLFLIIIIILYICKWPQWLWNNVWVLIPNPAPFFKPLYKVHNGDFKSWLGYSFYQTTPTPFESMVFPEVFDVYSQGLLKNVSRQDLNSLEKQKLLLAKSCPSGDSLDWRKCDSNKTDKNSGILPMGAQSCPYFSTKDGLEAAMDESGDDNYPCVNLDSDNSNALNLMPDCESVLQEAKNSLVHSNIHLQEDFLGSSINILDLVPTLPERWEYQDSPNQDDDENVFYNDNYNALSPDSENSADFGYPRICLDLDTIDSGFCDSECGSPVDSEFANNGTPPKPLSSDSYSGEEEIYERNYVKQWVPSHSVLPAKAVHAEAK